MLKKFAVAMAAVFAFAFVPAYGAPARANSKAKAHQVKKAKKTPERQCQETPGHFWIVANIGTVELPMLRGFCRKVHPVGPFADLV